MKKNRKKESQMAATDASMTVFMGMTLLLMMSLFFSMAETIRCMAMKRMAPQVEKQALLNMFAEYDRQLWEKYHILAVDGAYGSEIMDTEAIEKRLQTEAEENGNPGGNGIYFFRMQPVSTKLTNETLLTDQDGAGLIREAALAEKAAIPKEVVSKWEKSAGTNDTKNTKKQVEKLLENGESAMQNKGENRAVVVQPGETAALPDTKVSEKTTVPQGQSLSAKENPIEIVKEWKSKGILGQLLPEETKISENRWQSTVGKVSERTNQTGIAEEKIKTTKSDRLLFNQYIEDNFHHFGMASSNDTMQYQVEYILEGENEDRNNLSGVCEKLLGMREGENFIALCKDEKRMLEANELALALAGETANPGIIAAVKWGIVAAWAYVESVLDVRRLLQGGKVALLKKPAEWTSDITNLASCLDVHTMATDCQKGIQYTDYLWMLLLMLPQRKIAYRTMDLMENEIQKQAGCENCRMDHRIVRADTESLYEGKPLFFTYVVQLQGKLDWYHFQTKQTMSYL